MDERLKTISMTFFYGELTTTDIMVLKAHLLNIFPNDTIFSINEDNKFIIDFKYNDCLASGYINQKIIPITPEKYNEYSSMIAKELTNYNIIIDDIKGHILSSKKLKRFIKFYKTNNNKQNKKIINASKKLNIALNKGIDYDYIRHIN
ncbi:hypothetical protein [Lumpy skin disease virus]|uniref:Virion morphogenesis protein n=3 Tax=Capripoxvirus TaxID=10265 RepID=A0A1B2LPN6_9POXV|nr:LSDV078 hypothetical protein [Lumpy skin disease virus NI-2490]YP_001293269.1 hypothetical protein GTPV_gp074 [Goatpox virus Pellor]AAN02646.1 hypothetical protein [Lumpy skin disease virus NW-LW]AAN02803.1 hypothetical protein [Lumpy skin disease virus]AGZ95393.1 hypothetical protein [Goatpox virus FZ]AOA33036.1 hypothetical protein GTPV_gp074 [Goatpox virus]AAK85039.1 LSDV078 hypothetical protein [Lumpy skin disease virus NI-2490]